MELNINISHEDDNISEGVNVRLSGDEELVNEVVDYLLDCKVKITSIDREEAEYAHDVNDADIVSAILNMQIFKAYVISSAVGKGYTGDKSWYISHT